MYTILSGLILRRELRNSGVLPLLGGSMMTTSAFAFFAYSTRKSPASALTNVTFFILLIEAFILASDTASELSSTPITLPAFFEATIPIVPIPQYASITVSFFDISASWIAFLYSFSVCWWLI